MMRSLVLACMLGVSLSSAFVLRGRPRLSPRTPVRPFPRATYRVCRACVANLCMKVGVLFSTSTGNCETVGGYIVEAAKSAGLDVDGLSEITEIDTATVESYSGLIVGAPTWNTGADTERSGTSWDEWLYDTLPSLQLKGKKVAVFGLGDQIGYGDNFCDAAGELYDRFLFAGCKMVGMTSTDGYDHMDSKALRDGKFCGLMCDEDNQSDMSESRAKDWISQLTSEGLFE